MKLLKQLLEMFISKKNYKNQNLVKMFYNLALSITNNNKRNKIKVVSAEYTLYIKI